MSLGTNDIIFLLQVLAQDNKSGWINFFKNKKILKIKCVTADTQKEN